MSRINEEYESFSVVFEGDIRKLPGNPHKLQTPFGKIRSIGVGDAFRDVDAASERQEATATPSPSTHVAGPEAAIRKAGQVVIDDLIDRGGWCIASNDDLADYMTRIVDACVRAALATTEGQP